VDRVAESLIPEKIFTGWVSGAPVFIFVDVERFRMLRRVLTAVGIVEVLAPGTLLASAERVALENPGECDWRSWVAPGARLEGVLVLWLVWRSDRSYSAFKKFLGLVGLVALLFPRAYLEYGSDVAYTGRSSPEWKPWVYTGTRLVGLLYVIVALDEFRSG
jgi:hypothetical protein